MSKDYSLPSNEDELQSAKNSLENNGFKVLILDDLAEAREKIAEIIPEGSEIFTATSKTLQEAGIDKDANESGKYVSVRNLFMPLASDPEKAVEMRRIGSGSDYALGSVHAITQDKGHVFIASASGSQIPNYAYGASNFIWVVGAQKIVKDMDEALDRIENYTFHLEDERAKEAYGSGSSINKILIYRKEPRGRGTVILLRQTVGF
ncbi:MAG TPA: LUD domain-containing protein [Candidatus Saccharimonadales bacterium]|nr:LUD domain-containing protein [Candidatus Saccharimonadales bacterium]